MPATLMKSVIKRENHMIKTIATAMIRRFFLKFVPPVIIRFGHISKTAARSFEYSVNIIQNAGLLLICAQIFKPGRMNGRRNTVEELPRKYVGRRVVLHIPFFDHRRDDRSERLKSSVMQGKLYGPVNIAL